MCLLIKPYAKEKIAKRDIICYKFIEESIDHLERYYTKIISTLKRS